MSVLPTGSELGDIAASIARTSLSYDLLPYASNPFPSTQPARLAAIARLFALEPAPVGTARVLELGCAAGGNIVPLAARHPGAQFLGVDVSSAQVAAGRARIAHLGLSNIDIRCASFTDIGPADGAFDYIICHGVYSWVAAPLREAILRICRERLSPRGIALVSYNVLPGWRLRQALRDCFLLHVAGETDPRRRAQQVRTLLGTLQATGTSPGHYNAVVKAEAAALAGSSDDYIAHEFLDDANEPCTFADFAAAAERHGLGFLAEAELPSMIVSNYPAETARAIQDIARGQLKATEQYIDMLSGRTFRLSLLIASERSAQVDRRLSNERMEGLHFTGAGDLALARDAAGGGTLANAAGIKFATTAPVVMDVLARFVAAFPASTDIDDLIVALPAQARRNDGRALVRETMFKLVLGGLATAGTEPVRAATSASARLAACPLARADAARGDGATANLRHEHVGFDGLAQFVLPLLDGSRDTAAVTSAVLAAGRDGKLSFTRDGVAIDDPAQRHAMARANVDALFAGFTRAALLLP
jgi:methyltransferase-like protein/2-polyprenyl-3-methyl-5-hydroxy-6-metoxy-1,4-benzoquinol methylase